MNDAQQPDHTGDGDAIKVFLRVRPPDTVNNALPCSTSVLEVDSAKNAVILLAKPDPKVFTFDSVADTDCTQESVFSAVGKSLIESCVAGYNGTIFAYGQTGSGKTFTMLGPSEDCDNFKHELRGVIPRSFEHLFNLISRQHDLHGERKRFLCKCSFLEIYQEQVYDLLDPAASNLQLRENIKKGVFVDGLMEQVVATPNEAYEALSIGWLNRRVGATSMNRESSRSHAVFTLIIESKEQKNGVTNVRQSQLNLVDLAGSERQKDTNTVGIRLKEAGKINKSLSVLGNVIMSLVDMAHGRSRHVPYRDSKLTFLLRDSLGGNARTSIVACVHPDGRCFGETLSTLNFAKRAKMIKNKAVVNEDTQGNVAHLQAEVKRLRDMLVQFQSGSIPPTVPASAECTCTGSADQGASSADASEWRQKFAEAMLFRGKSEQEKEVLRQRISGLEEEGKKKDRMLQSSRMIIKFRENRISMLEKNHKTAEDPVISLKKTEEDIAAMKHLMDQQPHVAGLDRELHNLRAQLADARIRLNNSAATLLDPGRLQQLEQVFRDLQAAGRRDSAVVSPSVSGERSSIVSAQKLREKIETMEEENQKLKKQLMEERQNWETKEAGLQAELTAANNMTRDLERVLEANHLKHRIERDALTNLHCHTLKVMTTPTRTAYDLRSRTVVVNGAREKGEGLDTTIEMEEAEEDICQEPPPQIMLENAQEAFTEEIKTLQDANNSLQERVNEYEADLLRLQQQVSQLDLKNASLNEMLAKERTSISEQETENERVLKELREQMDTLTTNLTYAQEESRDLRILLQSSDRELKQERDKTKSNTAASDQKVNVLETQLLQVKSLLETVTNEVEAGTKEKEELSELLDTQRMEFAFLEERTAALEAALQEETRSHRATCVKLQDTERQLQQEKELQEQQIGKQQAENMAEVSGLKQCLDEATREKEESRSQLETVSAELSQAKSTITELQRNIADSQEAMLQQVGRVQDLKNKLTAAQDEKEVLQELADSRAAEVSSSQERCEALHGQLSAKDEELSRMTVDVEMLREDLNYYQEQNDKMVQEHESVRHQLEAVQKEKELLTGEIQRIKEELSEREGRLEKITQLLEEAQSRQTLPGSPEKSRELLAQEKKLCTMIEELQASWRQSHEECQQLKTENAVLKQASAEKASLSLKCQELQHQLENHEAVYTESMKQLKEVAEAERSEVVMLRESMREAQRQQEAGVQEKQMLLSRLEDTQKEKEETEHERDRLKSIIEKSYNQEDQLTSKVEVLKEENKRIQEELSDCEKRLKQLAEDNAVLAGHANHSQKVNYMKRLQMDYNDLKEKYTMVVKEKQSRALGCSASPLRDRTNLAPAASAQSDLVEKVLEHSDFL